MYSVRDFVKKAKELQAYDNHMELLQFMLTGEVPGEHQVFLDPLRNMLPQDHPIHVQRNYDSLIGLTPSISIEAPLSVYPIGPSHEALSTSVHIDITLNVNGVSYVNEILFYD